MEPIGPLKPWFIQCCILALSAFVGAAFCGEDDGALAKALASLQSDVLTADERKQWNSVLDEDAYARLREAERRDSQAWSQVHSKEEWERFRDARMQKLRASLSLLPPPAPEVKARTTKTFNEKDFNTECVLIETRPGVVITANLYVPQPLRARMPGILICHSHHAPKTEGELQLMGGSWARAGAIVLVMDQLGHGERRQQNFAGRQDYFSRFYTGMQLQLVGESLTGWMVADLMRGVDFLLSREGIDREKIILIGAVAGGGDPAAVTAALDTRIACAVPFNFGGPQPETKYPLPANAEETFNYAGGGSFESTRNLRLSVRDGFLPYAIVGAVAPRSLIYGHEFAWDQEHDPVWKRLQTIYGYYGATDRLGSAHGFGGVKLKPPEASHCNNVGSTHRSQIYPYWQRWFDMPHPQEDLFRRHVDQLDCLERTINSDFKPKPVHELARTLGAERGAAARAQLETLAPDARRKKLQQDWALLLGEIEPRAMVKTDVRETKEIGAARVERIVFQVEPRISLPALMLLPRERPGPTPAVIAVAEEGKQGFLSQRPNEIASLLKDGVAVCLVDLRGAGEAGGSNEDAGRHKRTTDAASTEFMLGQTLLGSRLRDLRSVMQYLRTRPEIDAKRLGLWGDSFTPINEPFEDQPDGKGKRPHEVRALGAMMALFGSLYENDVRAVIARRGLLGFDSVLGSHFCYVPLDTIVPGALTAGDLNDVIAALAPTPLRIEGMVDGRNCLASDAALQKFMAPAKQGYAREESKLTFSTEIREDAGAWLGSMLKK